MMFDDDDFLEGGAEAGSVLSSSTGSQAGSAGGMGTRHERRCKDRMEEG